MVNRQFIVYSEEYRKKCSLRMKSVLKGKSFCSGKKTDEHKKKLSVAHKGKTLSLNHRQNISLAHLNKKRSDVVKAKMAINNFLRGKRLNKLISRDTLLTLINQSNIKPEYLDVCLSMVMY